MAGREGELRREKKGAEAEEAHAARPEASGATMGAATRKRRIKRRACQAKVAAL